MFAELIFLAISNDIESACEIARSFHRRFVDKESDLTNDNRYSPIDVRFQIYEAVGLLGDIKWELDSKSDYNSVQL